MVPEADAEASAVAEVFNDQDSLSLRSGQEVCAFYRLSDHPDGCRFVKVKQHVDRFPRVGQSAGWLPGTVVEDFDRNAYKEADKSTYVRVLFQGTFFDPAKGHKDGVELRVRPNLVRRALDSQPPVLSLLVLRWWDYWSNPRWSDYDPSSDHLLLDLFDGPGGVSEALTGEHEAHTVWVKASQDLERISGEEVRGLLRAPNIAAWYFVRPVRRLDADARPGYVCEQQFFNLLQRVERAGVPTGWPSMGHVHRLLAGKLWETQMSLHPDYQLPATTRIHYAEFAENPEFMAEQAVGALLEMRRYAELKPAVTAADLKGIVKLGFRWPEEASQPFCGAASLVEAVQRLLARPGTSQTVCVVQEMVLDVVCELRLLCFHDAVRDDFVRERLWMRWQAWDSEPNAAASRDGPTGAAVPEDVALEEFFFGSESAMRDATEQAEQLFGHWLNWFYTECPDPPPTFRLDLLVSHVRGRPVVVWTCDIGECGSSLCGLEVAGRSAAVVNNAMKNDESGRFPLPLPPIQRRSGDAA